MPPVPNLPTAAGESFNNLQQKWAGNNLKSALTAFWQATLPTFPEENVESHPVSNWLVVIASLAERMAATGVPFDQLTNAVDAVYRLCWMTQYLKTASLITTAQANVVLAQYNAHLA